MIRHYIWDADGTLWPTEWTLSVKVAEIANSHGMPVNTETVFRNFAGLGEADKFRAIARHCNVWIDEKKIRTLTDLHIKAKDALYRPGLIELFNNSAKTLEWIDREKAVQSVCSNANNISLLKQAIEDTGTYCYFNGRVYTPSCVGGLSKPNPAMIFKAMNDRQFKPGETACIGDNMVDMIAARAAGIPEKQRIAFINPLYGSSTSQRVEMMKQAGAGSFFSHYENLPALIQSLG